MPLKAQNLIQLEVKFKIGLEIMFVIGFTLQSAKCVNFKGNDIINNFTLIY